MKTLPLLASMNLKPKLNLNAVLAACAATATLTAWAGDIKSPVTAWFDARSGVLTVRGNDFDNDLLVASSANGSIAVNGGTVPVAGGPISAAKVRRVDVQSGAGQDIIVVGGVPAARLNGGEESDIFIWIDPDPVIDFDGKDLVIWNTSDTSSPGQVEFNFDLFSSTGGVSLNDYNRDGIVNSADYVVWGSSLGEDELILTLSKDSGVAADYNLWRMNYGSTGAESSDGDVDVHDYQVWR